MTGAITCPSCEHEHETPVRLVVETSRRAAKRLVVPEVVHICLACHALLILGLHPIPQKETNR